MVRQEPGTDDRSALRKKEHLTISLDYDPGSSPVTTGLENYAFIHQSLPEIDFNSIDLSTTLLDLPLSAPIIVSPMVGGIEAAAGINRCLAEAAQTLGLAMGVGSQRCMIEEPETAYTYQVRQAAPDIPLFANLGAVQLNYGYGIDECRRAVESIEADALVLHLNPFQEVFQPEGNTNFSGLLEKIAGICHNLPVPVIVKEVGFGISGEIAARLAGAGVSGIDVAGSGGTSWSRIEALRNGRRKSRLAATFSTWGIPTAECLRMVRERVTDVCLIASGGIKTGLDIAKTIALGADAAGIALPLLKPGTLSTDAVIAALEEVIEGLKIAMFCTGSAVIADLKNTSHLVKREKG